MAGFSDFILAINQAVHAYMGAKGIPLTDEDKLSTEDTGVMEGAGTALSQKMNRQSDMSRDFVIKYKKLEATNTSTAAGQETTAATLIQNLIEYRITALEDTTAGMSAPEKTLLNKHILPRLQKIKDWNLKFATEENKKSVLDAVKSNFTHLSNNLNQRLQKSDNLEEYMGYFLRDIDVILEVAGIDITDPAIQTQVFTDQSRALISDALARSYTTWTARNVSGKMGMGEDKPFCSPKFVLEMAEATSLGAVLAIDYVISANVYFERVFYDTQVGQPEDNHKKLEELFDLSYEAIKKQPDALKRILNAINTDIGCKRDQRLSNKTLLKFAYRLLKDNKVKSDQYDVNYFFTLLAENDGFSEVSADYGSKLEAIFTNAGPTVGAKNILDELLANPMVSLQTKIDLGFELIAVMDRPSEANEPTPFADKTWFEFFLSSTDRAMQRGYFQEADDGKSRCFANLPSGTGDTIRYTLFSSANIKKINTLWSDENKIPAEIKDVMIRQSNSEIKYIPRSVFDGKFGFWTATSVKLGLPAANKDTAQQFINDAAIAGYEYDSIKNRNKAGNYLALAWARAVSDPSLRHGGVDESTNLVKLMARTVKYRLWALRTDKQNKDLWVNPTYGLRAAIMKLANPKTGLRADRIKDKQKKALLNSVVLSIAQEVRVKDFEDLEKTKCLFTDLDLMCKAFHINIADVYSQETDGLTIKEHMVAINNKCMKANASVSSEAHDMIKRIYETTAYGTLRHDRALRDTGAITEGKVTLQVPQDYTLFNFGDAAQPTPATSNDNTASSVHNGDGDRQANGNSNGAVSHTNKLSTTDYGSSSRDGNTGSNPYEIITDSFYAPSRNSKR